LSASNYDYYHLLSVTGQAIQISANKYKKSILKPFWFQFSLLLNTITGNIFTWIILP